MAASSRALAEEWTRKLLTVLHLFRQEEAKGEPLPRALDLFVKDLMGEKTPAREEAFHAGLERSVARAVRYFDGSGKCSEISPGLSCKEVEEATHDLLEHINALAVAESPCREVEKEARTPSQPGQRTARRRERAGSEHGSDKASMDHAGPPEGELSSPPPNGSQENRKEPTAFRPIQEPEPLPTRTLLPIMQEEWPPLSSASAEPSASPPQPTPEQTGLEMEPCAVVVYPVAPEEEGSERRARVFYPMTPVASKPALHPPPPVPLSLTLSAIMCALPMLVPGAPEDSPSRCRGVEECDAPRPVPSAEPNTQSSGSEPEPAALPTATVQEPSGSGSCNLAALMEQPDETSASHTAAQSPASAGQMAGAGNPSAHSIRGSRVSKFSDESRHTERAMDSRYLPSQTSNIHASVTETVAHSMAGVPNPASPWCHYKPPPAVYPIALSANQPATSPGTGVEQVVVGADPNGEHFRGPRSAPEHGTTVLPSPLHSEPTGQAFESKVQQDSQEDLRHTEWHERSRSLPPQTSNTRPPSTDPASPFTAGVPYPSARWYHHAAPPSVYPFALRLNRPTAPPYTGMEENVRADTCSGNPRSSRLAPEKDTRVLPTPPAPEPTDQARGSKGQESAKDSRHKGRSAGSRPTPPNTCEDQSPSVGPASQSMAGMPCPSAPWYHYAAPPGIYPVIISPNQRAAGLRAGIEPTVGVDTYGGYLRGPGSTLEQGAPIFPPLSPFNPTGQMHQARGPDSPISSRNMEWCDSPRPVPSPIFGLQSPATGPPAPPMAGVHPPAARWYSYPGSPAAYPGFFPANRPVTHPGKSVRLTVSEDDYDGHSQGPAPTPEHGSPMSQPLSPPASPKYLRHAEWSDSPRSVQSTSRNAQSIPSGPAEPITGGVPHPAAPSRHHSAPSAVCPVVLSADRPENYPFAGAGPRGDVAAACDVHPEGLGWGLEEGVPALSPLSPVKPEGEARGSRESMSPDSPRCGGWSENSRSVPPPACSIQVPAMGPGAFSMAGVPYPSAPWCHFPVPPGVYPGFLSANGSPTYPFVRAGGMVGAEGYGGHPQGLGSPPEQDSPRMLHHSRSRVTHRANRHQAKGLHRPKDGVSRGNDGAKDPRSRSSKHGDFRAGGRRPGTKQPHRRDRLSSP